MEEVGDTYRDSTTPPPSYHLSHLQDRINAIQESTKQCLDSATNDGPVTNLPELWVMFQEALHAKEHACLGLQDWVLQMKWLLIKACNDCIREGVENISAQTLLALLKSSQILTELVAEQLDRLVPKVLDDVDYCVEV